MATLRSEVRIARSTDEVGRTVSDPVSVSTWLPGIESCSVTGTTRHLELANGSSLDEEIVTNDDRLRRFQYRIIRGAPVERHLATIDVLEDTAGALVIYSTEVAPDELADQMGPAIEAGLNDLKDQLERS